MCSLSRCTGFLFTSSIIYQRYADLLLVGFIIDRPSPFTSVKDLLSWNEMKESAGYSFCVVKYIFDPAEDSSPTSGWGKQLPKSFRLVKPIYRHPHIHSLELLASFPHPADCIERNCWRRDNVFFFFFFLFDASVEKTHRKWSRDI